MKNYLQIVKIHCFQLEQEGKITPITFNYPSFEINETIFRKAVLDYVTERVKIGLLTKNYKNENISYHDLFLAEERQESNIFNKKDETYFNYLNQILPNQINLDEHLKPKEIILNSLKDIFVNRLQHILMDLETIRIQSENKINTIYLEKKDEFLATILMIEKQIPYSYKSIKKAIETAPFIDLAKELQEMKNSINIAVVQQIYLKDKQFVADFFPSEYAKLKINKNLILK